MLDLTTRNGTSAPPAVEALLGDTRTVATMTALSTRTIKRLVALGSIPGAVKIGRALRFDLKQVRRWIERGCPQ